MITPLKKIPLNNPNDNANASLIKTTTNIPDADLDDTPNDQRL
jgi:hypothetical protein